MTVNAFVYGQREDVVRYAKTKRWRANGRASWLTRSDVCVHFLAFEEQLAGVSEGEHVYVVGKLSAECTRTLKKVGAILVQEIDN